MWRCTLAVDIQIAVPQEAIRVSRVVTVPGLAVRTLRISGSDFRSVDEVLMNEVPSPTFLVLDKTTLVAQVPDALKNSAVTSVSVLSRNLLITPKSFIKFRLGAVPGKTSGILRLMQLFLRLLLQTPGSDIFAPKLGGGALAHLGQSISTEEGSDVISSFIISVDNTKSQIVQIQGRNQLIPPDERLLSANVISAGYNKNETAIITSIQLDSQAGSSAVARFEL